MTQQGANSFQFRTIKPLSFGAEPVVSVKRNKSSPIDCARVAARRVGGQSTGRLRGANEEEATREWIRAMAEGTRRFVCLSGLSMDAI